MSRVVFPSSGRRTFLRRLTDSSWSTCVLTTPVRSRHNSSTSALARSCFSPADASCAYIRMLVSTKYLSLMELVAGLGWCPLEVETLAEPRERASPRLVESLPIPHHGLQTISEQGADGPSFFGGHYARFSNQVGVEF